MYSANKPTHDEFTNVENAYAQAEKLGMDRIDYLKNKADPEVLNLLLKEGMEAFVIMSARRKGIV